MREFKVTNSIIRKMIYFFALLILLVISIIVTGSYYLTKVQDLTVIIDNNYKIKNNIEAIENDLLSSKILPDIEDYTILNKEDIADNISKRLPVIENIFEVLSVKVNKDLKTSYENVINDYEVLRDNVINREKYDGNTINLYKRYKEVIYRELEEIDLILIQEKDKELENMKRTLSILIVFVGVIIFAGIYIVNDEIISPIKNITGFFKRNAQSYSFTEFKIENNNEIGLLMENYNQLKHRLVTMESVIRHISAKDKFEEIFDYIFDNFKDFIPYDRIGIAVLNKDEEGITALRAKSNFQILLGEEYTESLENSSLVGVIKDNEPRIINDLEEYLINKPTSKSTEIILKEGMRSSLTLPLLVGEKCVGVVFFSSSQKNSYDKKHINLLSNIANSLAVSFNKSFLQHDLVISTVVGFAKLVESKDNETGDHLERMSRYSVLMAELLNEEGYYTDEIDEGFMKKLSVYSQLHDIGKVGIKDNILLKPGKLTFEEFEEMKKHTNIGAEILENMNMKLESYKKDYYKMGIDIAKCHHEKYDGSGYPEGLIGDDIPVSARIVAIGDVFDALTSPRPYKEAFDLEKTIGIILDGRGKHFDPIMVDVFIKYKSKFIELKRYLWAKENQKNS